MDFSNLAFAVFSKLQLFCVYIIDIHLYIYICETYVFYIIYMFSMFFICSLCFSSYLWFFHHIYDFFIIFMIFISYLWFLYVLYVFIDYIGFEFFYIAIMNIEPCGFNIHNCYIEIPKIIDFRCFAREIEIILGIISISLGIYS